MLKILKILTLSVLLPLSGAPQVSAEGMNFELYQKFLDQFIKKDKTISGIRLNVVDYKGINKAVKGRSGTVSLYEQVLKMFKGVNTSSLKTREEKLAFWINVYNIGAIKMIVDHYPVDSIRSRKISWIKNPWGKEIITVGGKGYSLSEIEHDILLKRLKEPMAHFAIVCASVSCPDLSEKVFKPGTLNEQLASMARSFLANPKKGLKIDQKKGEVYFSMIFKFDSSTFPDGAKDAISLVVPNIGKEDARYLETGSYSIKYFDYDWSVNDLARSM